MSRKSQLEKFEARVAKAKKDEEVIKQSEIKENTLENRAGKIVKNYGLSTEDIFMIITRESSETFVKMWNNSMENVVRETLRTEIKAIVQETIQQELAEAYRGIIKGMTTAAVEKVDMEKLIKSELENITKFTEEQIEANEITDNIHELNTENNIQPENDEFYEELKQALIEQHYMGVDVTVAKTFKKSGGRNNTLYQKFVKRNKGKRGYWKEYVEAIISTIEEA